MKDIIAIDFLIIYETNSCQYGLFCKDAAASVFAQDNTPREISLEERESD